MYSTLLRRPRTSARFANLMELYEKNYMLIRLLAPQLRMMDAALYVSRTEADKLPLEFSRVEHSRYTTTFNLTYRFSSQHRGAREPNLMIRVYHDAHTCEIVSGLLPSFPRESRRVRGLADSHRLNRFLHKWLSYCLQQGHMFNTGSVVDPAVGKTLGQVCWKQDPASLEKISLAETSGKTDQSFVGNEPCE
jgi:uncharacterized protein YqiB (DUF1249 family)